jgi:guanylate kinase
VSEAAKQIMKNTKLVLLVGPTSSGRNTIINELLKSGEYHYIISDTTRQPRVNNGLLEQNGREYWFRSEEEVLEDLRKGEFLEAAIIHNQQVSGITSEDNKVAINEIETVGADNIHKINPGAMFFFIVPPSVDEWLVRMRARGELPPAEIRRRLESAVHEMATALERDFYCFVVNDTFMHTARTINEIIMAGHTTDDVQAKSIATAREVLADIKAYLGQ